MAFQCCILRRIRAMRDEWARGGCKCAITSQNIGIESVLALIAVFVVTVLIWRRFGRRRLRLPPGPMPLPIVGNWLQVGNDLNQRNLAAYARKYGDVCLLRMGQRNVVVVSSPEMAKEVLHTQGVEFGSRPRNVVFDIFTGQGQDMVFTLYGEHWRRMRRIMTLPFFTNKVVQHQRHAWESEIDAVIRDVRATPGSATTGTVIRHRLQLMMYNILFTIMFERRFEKLDDPLFLKLRALNNQRSSLAQSFEYNYGDFIPILRPFLRSYLKRCQKVKDDRFALFKQLVEDRRKVLSVKRSNEGTGGERCAMDHLIDAQARNEITEDNVLYIIENINVAAIETTLWSIEWGIAELVNNPKVQQRVKAELDSVLGQGTLVTEPDIMRLPYLQAVIKETLRYHMPIPLLVPHMNLQQAKLGGYDIPAESKVLVNAWWLANNPKLWDAPETFNPDRFLDVNVEASGNDFRYLPFGVGRRSCPGIILAMPILALILGRLVATFELLPPPGKTQLDLTEKGGQFSLHLMNHSNIVLKPRA